jgi:hypothetical protein
MNEKKAKALRNVVKRLAGALAPLGYVQTKKGSIVVAPKTQREVYKNLKKTAGRGR